MDIKYTNGNFLLSLPQKPRDYILEIIKEIDSEVLISIYIFGSHVRGSVSEISDVDLIVVVDDSSDEMDISKIEKKLNELEIKHNYRKNSTKIIDKFLQILDAQTGMFKSSFVCKKCDFINGRFHKIFRVNPISEIISPTAIVLSSVFDQACLVYGKDSLNEVKRPKIKKSPILQSFITTFLLSSAQIPFYLISDKATKYSLEALKWSLYNCYYVLPRANKNLKYTTNYFLDVIPFTYTQKFFYLRDNFKPDLFFTLLAPYYILKLHAVTLKKL